MLLTTGVTGQPFGGADIPSFFGPQTDNTFICGYQLGIFMPFFRAHSHEEWTVREPYVQSARVQSAIKHAVDTRYALFHYIYTTFYITTKEGSPLLRPMYYEFPEDENTFSLEK